jgi:hypothetical protein
MYILLNLLSCYCKIEIENVIYAVFILALLIIKIIVSNISTAMHNFTTATCMSVSNAHVMGHILYSVG